MCKKAGYLICKPRNVRPILVIFLRYILKHTYQSKFIFRMVKGVQKFPKLIFNLIQNFNQQKLILS